MPSKIYYFSLIFLTMLPVLTGLALLCWLTVSSKQPILGPILNVLSGILACIIIFIFDRPKSILLDSSNYIPIIIFVSVNALCTICWIYALKVFTPQVTAFVEISFPLFMVVFSLIFIGSSGLTITQAIGAAITVFGINILIWGQPT